MVFGNETPHFTSGQHFCALWPLEGQGESGTSGIERCKLLGCCYWKGMKPENGCFYSINNVHV